MDTSSVTILHLETLEEVRQTQTDVFSHGNTKRYSLFVVTRQNGRQDIIR